MTFDADRLPPPRPIPLTLDEFTRLADDGCPHCPEHLAGAAPRRTAVVVEWWEIRLTARPVAVGEWEGGAP